MKKKLPDSFLEDHYAGDAAWAQYVSMCEEEFPRFGQEQTQLIHLLKDHHDLALVIFQKVGDNSLDWINQQVPALNGLLPINCLDEPHLIKRLRECLLRMP